MEKQMQSKFRANNGNKKNNFMEYKGYHATVDYSQDDNILFGTIVGINDLITFEAESISDLKVDFEEAVDDYLATCAQLGREPEKEFKGQFNVRIAPSLHKKAAIKAAKQKMKLNKFVEMAIQHAVELD
jgi:predicted HicB family RNase H-like nuclease